MGVMTPKRVREARGRKCPVVEMDLDMVPAAQVRAEVRRLVSHCAGNEVGDAVRVSDELIVNGRQAPPRTLGRESSTRWSVPHRVASCATSSRPHPPV